MPRSLRRPWLLVGIASLFTVLVTTPCAAAPQVSLQTQRAAFKQAYANAKAGNNAWRAQRTALASYPLYPWLEAIALEHDLDKVPLDQVQRYLKRYHGLLPAQDLRHNYLLALVRRQDWKSFHLLYHPGMGAELACYALQGKLAGGGRLDFQRDLAQLWRSPSLPAACTLIQEWAHQHGLLTRQRLWSRIDRAVDAGNGGTVAALASWLDGHDQSQAEHLALALRQPGRAADQAIHWPANQRNRKATMLAMEKLVRGDRARAEKLWPGLRKHYRFTHTQQHDMQAWMALFAATDFTDDAIARLAALPSSAQTEATRAWRVRVALARRDWPAALKALDALTPAQKHQGEWTYLRARALDALGRQAEARVLYAKQARLATYYGFLAADQVNQPYRICPREPVVDQGEVDALLQQPIMRRAFELFAVGLYADARQVWHRALRETSTHTRQLAAMAAWQQGWYNRAIRTFSYGALMQHYTQRYPLADEHQIIVQSNQAGIDPAWTYAIIRAESAWVPDANSSANARGLMQILPITARQIAQRQGIPFDGNLYDPATNITLGTRYLARLADRFGGAPWLASAAYNAGPTAVNRWLADRATLPPDLFVATIPYKETREYVMRVLAYSVIYDWRMHGNAVDLVERMPTPGQTYTPPDKSTPRKAVLCTP